MDAVKVKNNFDDNADVVLYKGDCLKLLRQIPDEHINLIVTSPPYNLGKSYERRMNLDEYINQQRAVIHECIRVLKDTGSICWQVGNFVKDCEIIPLDVVLYPIFTEKNLHLRNRIVWHFGHGLHASKRFSGRYEVILWFTKSDKYVFNLDEVRVPQKYPQKKHFKGPKKGQLSGNPLGKNPTDVWEIPNVKANHVEKTIHPCQFPVELVERLVLSMTNEGDWVLDPFMGVGSSAIAALIHNRKAAGAEILEEYIQIAQDRIQSAECGELRVRPMNREVYNPEKNNNVPPKYVYLNGQSRQLAVLENIGRKNVTEKKQ